MAQARYQDLAIWQKGMDLAECIYKKTTLLPKDELFGLVNQMRRAAVSIPSNIAEGYARQSTREFKHFLTIASGSLAELESQLLLCGRIHYLNENDCKEVLDLTAGLQKMLAGMSKHLTEKMRDA
jgi:four helix bundle protein